MNGDSYIVLGIVLIVLSIVLAVVGELLLRRMNGRR